jgi:hypothetical protein
MEPAAMPVTGEREHVVLEDRRDVDDDILP